MDAPHTGARLETRILQRPRNKLCDAPHTGARLETVLGRRQEPDWRMPPTRGHDLKRSYPGLCSKHPPGDAPHTGARLETRSAYATDYATILDAPHTGARLETLPAMRQQIFRRMPPTRGHDLKHQYQCIFSKRCMDAPHTGARLETTVFRYASPSSLDAPHTGARLETISGKSGTGDREMPPTRGHDLKRPQNTWIEGL